MVHQPLIEFVLSLFQRIMRNQYIVFICFSFLFFACQNELSPHEKYIQHNDALAKIIDRYDKHCDKLGMELTKYLKKNEKAYFQSLSDSIKIELDAKITSSYHQLPYSRQQNETLARCSTNQWVAGVQSHIFETHYKAKRLAEFRVDLEALYTAWQEAKSSNDQSILEIFYNERGSEIRAAMQNIRSFSTDAEAVLSEFPLEFLYNEP